VLRFLRLLWPITSVMKKAVTSCSSWTTFSDLHKKVHNSRSSLVVCHQRWDINQQSQPKWVTCRNVLHQPRKDRLPRCRRCMCQPTTSPTQLRQQPLRTSTQPLCFHVQSRSKVSIQLLTHSTR